MKTLIVERDERGVVSVQLNRLEKKNAIDYQMFQDLLEVFDEMSRSDTDRVLVLSGAGGNFSAGADLGGDTPLPPARPHALLRVGGARAPPAAAAGDREDPRRRGRRRAQPRARLRSDRDRAVGAPLGDAEGMAQTVNTASEDTREAIRAFSTRASPSSAGVSRWGRGRNSARSRPRILTLAAHEAH